MSALSRSHLGLSPQLLAPDTFPARPHHQFPFNSCPPKAGISLGTQQCHGEHRTTFNPQLSTVPRSLNPTQLQQGVPRLPRCRVFIHSADAKLWLTETRGSLLLSCSKICTCSGNDSHLGSLGRHFSLLNITVKTP